MLLLKCVVNPTKKIFLDPALIVSKCGRHTGVIPMAEAGVYQLEEESSPQDSLHYLIYAGTV